MKNLLKALADFQNEVPVIHEETKGYNYTFANLNSIFKIIKPLLKKHGLVFIQPLTATSLRTIIYHVDSGENIESEISLIDGVALKGQNAFQILGSQITYLRRYSLSAMLGLITDKDIDACGTPEPKIREKEVLTKNHPKFEAVKKALEGNYTIEQVEEKYILSNEIKKLLK